MNMLFPGKPCEAKEKEHMEKFERRMTGLHFWAVGYWVSTVGRDEDAVRRYIGQQEHWDQGQGQLFD